MADEGIAIVAAHIQPTATGAGTSHLNITRSSLPDNWRREASWAVIAQRQRPEPCIESFADPITSRAARYTSSLFLPPTIDQVLDRGPFPEPSANLSVAPTGRIRGPSGVCLTSFSLAEKYARHPTDYC
jgi:hypothetical protein